MEWMALWWRRTGCWINPDGMRSPTREALGIGLRRHPGNDAFGVQGVFALRKAKLHGHDLSHLHVFGRFQVQTVHVDLVVQLAREGG